MAHFSNPSFPYQPIIADETDFSVASTTVIWCADPPNTMEFNPFAPISSIVSTADDALALHSDWFSDTDSDSEHDVSCFVTDLFENRRFSEHSPTFGDHDRGLESCPSPFSHSADDLAVSEFENSGDIESNYIEELWSTLGVESESRVSETDTGMQIVDSVNSGLRVVDVDSDSESDNGMIGGLQLLSGADGENDINWVESSSPPDSFFFQGQRIVYEDFEWEEVEERVDEREYSSVLVDGAEELSIASGFSNEEELGEEAGRNLEWEILLVWNNIGRNTNGERDIDSEPYLIQDDYLYAGEFDTLFGQFVESENALKGSPPAAKSVMENLPLVELKTENMLTEVVVCAVCKDRISSEEKVRKLPCCHYYHDDCIIPWLNIRNTCPVCRYELPTDDPDYERKKNRRAAGGLQMDLQVRYNVELIA